MAFKGIGGKAGAEIGKYLRQVVREIWADLKTHDIAVSLDGVPLLGGKKIRIGLEPKHDTP